MCGSLCASAPPTVATLRTRTFESVRSARAMTGQPFRATSALSKALSVVMAPMRRLPFASIRSSPSPRRLTRRFGRSTPAFIISMSAVPPENARVSSASRRAVASGRLRGCTSSNGAMAYFGPWPAGAGVYFTSDADRAPQEGERLAEQVVGERDASGINFRRAAHADARQALAGQELGAYHIRERAVRRERGLVARALDARLQRRQRIHVQQQVYLRAGLELDRIVGRQINGDVDDRGVGD